MDNSGVFTYRTATRRVPRSERIIRRWKALYGMRTWIDTEGVALIPET